MANKTPQSVIFLMLTLCFAVFYSNGQSSTATYNAGNIPTPITNYSAACNGPTTPLVVTIPAGASVTGIDISYDFTATGGAWMSEQRSRIHCQETGNTEITYNGTGGSSGGTESYNRTGVTIANGISATGTLTFEMQAWRTWGGTACDQVYNYINNNTWTITVYYFIPGPMLYSSSTTTQNNTSSIQNCDGNAEIIGVEVVTTGSSPTIDLTAMTIGTTGTTNLAEVNAVNVYYTGSSPIFATTNLLGTAAPGASVNITGAQTLLMGTNYFWVEYQLNPILTNGNSFDATCTQITVGGTNYTPALTSPAGNRTVGACNPGPGGISTGFQTWFDANTGTIGAPVTTWSNIGPNANVPQIDSPNGAPLLSTMERANFNNIVDLQGGYNGTFHYEVSDRTQVIAGNEVTMFCAYQGTGAPDLIFNYHGSVLGGGPGSGNQWHAWGFRHAGIGGLYGAGVGLNYNAGMITNMSSNAGFVGLSGSNGSNAMTSTNGVVETMGNCGTWYSGAGNFELSVGYWPGFGTGRDVMEALLWDYELSAVEQSRVEAYLAIKYGITLGTNGTSMDYLSPFNGAVVWDVSANTGFNYDIAGVMRADASRLDQRKSHSTNGPGVDVFNDIVTIANGTNFSNPSIISNDGDALIWGHDNGPLINTGVVVNYPTDNGEVIQGIFTREWKAQETGTTSTMTIEFDLSSVVGVGGVLGSNDLQHIRLLVDEDGNYAVGATSIAPTSYNNATGIIYFQHDFISGTGNPMDQFRGYFFTLGTTNMLTSPLPVVLGHFNVDNAGCETNISWSTLSEQHCDYFIIDRSYDMEEWEEVTRVSGANNSSQELNYSVVDRAFNRNGAIYYRLTQVDTDGTATVMGTKGIQAACENNAQPIIYPNPSTGQLNVFTTVSGTVTLFDAQGRKITTEILNEGENVLSLDHLASGTYTASILLDNSKFFRDQWVKM